MTNDIVLKLAKGLSYAIDANNDSMDPTDGFVRLAGFQSIVGVQRVTLLAEDWRKELQKAVGMFPVFIRDGGGMFNLTIPVESVEEPVQGSGRSTFTATVEVTVDNAPPGYSNARLADDIRDMVFSVISEETDLDAVMKQVIGPAEPLIVDFDLEVTTDKQQKVWVATVSDENDSPGPAVYVAPYVSATADNLLAIIRKQQGVPEGEDLLDWMDLRGKTAVWDTYYVETGEE